MEDHLTIGEVAVRSGVATSALRYYESRGLITSERTPGNQRRFPRSTLRTVAVIRAAHNVGMSLDDVGDALAALPGGRTPTKEDWSRMAKEWRSMLDDRITGLEALRDELGDCIGCGCLSLRSCALFNPADRVAGSGTGARYLSGVPRPTVG